MAVSPAFLLCCRRGDHRHGTDLSRRGDSLPEAKVADEVDRQEAQRHVPLYRPKVVQTGAPVQLQDRPTALGREQRFSIYLDEQSHFLIRVYLTKVHKRLPQAHQGTYLKYSDAAEVNLVWLPMMGPTTSSLQFRRSSPDQAFTSNCNRSGTSPPALTGPRRGFPLSLHVSDKKPPNWKSLSGNPDSRSAEQEMPWLF